MFSSDKFLEYVSPSRDKSFFKSSSRNLGEIESQDSLTIEHLSKFWAHVAWGKFISFSHHATKLATWP
jgi:hypothetical protein